MPTAIAPRRSISETRSNRIARLMLAADNQRAVIGLAADDYRDLTAPVDRLVQRSEDLVSRHPMLVSAGLALGSLVFWRVRGKLPRLIRGAMFGISIVKALRAGRARS